MKKCKKCKAGKKKIYVPYSDEDSTLYKCSDCNYENWKERKKPPKTFHVVRKPSEDCLKNCDVNCIPVYDDEGRRIEHSERHNGRIERFNGKMKEFYLDNSRILNNLFFDFENPSREERDAMDLLIEKLEEENNG